MPASLVLVLGVFLAQAPAADLQRDLDVRDPATRRLAAVEVAASGAESEAWLLREIGRGSPARRRALLLAAALMGSPATATALEDAARPGSRPDEVRAYALLLAGAFLPEAPRDPADRLRKLPSDFERACFLAGLLAQADRTTGSAEDLLGDRARDPTLRALCAMLRALRGEEPPLPGAEDAVGRSGAVLAVLLPGRAALARDAIVEVAGALYPNWSLAARRSPPRELAELRGAALSGTGDGVALALYELEDAAVREAFEMLDARIADPRSKGWLWGAAGDRGLLLPNADGVHSWQVAGLIRLALSDPGLATEVAVRWRESARLRFASAEPLEETWPAALVLALAPDSADQDLLRERISAAEGPAAQRLHPIWQLASGRTSSAEARRRLLHEWSRELGAGYLGYLDREGPRWVAYLLVSGTRAASENAALVVDLPALAGPRDHSRDSELYADLLELLLSGLYRWSLP